MRSGSLSLMTLTIPLSNSFPLNMCYFLPYRHMKLPVKFEKAIVSKFLTESYRFLCIGYKPFHTLHTISVHIISVIIHV